MQQAEQPASVFSIPCARPQRLENLRDIDPKILRNQKLQDDLAAIEADRRGVVGSWCGHQELKAD